MTLTVESAAELLDVLRTTSGFPLPIPPVRADQILKIVEIELRSKARYAEIYAHVLAALDPEVEADAASDDGLTVWIIETDSAGTWHVVSAATAPTAALGGSVEDGLARLEEQQQIFRPKCVVARPSRATKPRPALSESDGAGALAQTPRLGEAPRATDAEVDAAEQALGTRMPAGYRTFVRTLGEGVYGNKLRVYPPARVVGDLASWRERIERYWFWGETPISQAHALESICVADTVDGDEIIVHPSDPDHLYFLPRHSTRARSLGRGLASAISKIARAKSTKFEPL